MFGSLFETVETQLDALRAPAFKFDDAGLNIFDEYEPYFRQYLEAGDRGMLAWFEIGYAQQLLALAERLNWKQASFKKEAIEAAKTLFN